jgi:hypothetical protein
MSEKTDLNQKAGADCVQRLVLGSSDTPETDAVAALEGNWDTKALRMGAFARKLERKLEATRSQLERLLKVEDTYGNTASMSHPRMTREISVARKFLSENAKANVRDDES